MAMEPYTYWMLGSAEFQPLIVIADASDGPWVHESTPTNLPELPIQFLHMREGIFGPVLGPAWLVLFRQDLMSALSKLSIDNFDAHPAAIRQPRSQEANRDYCVIKVHDRIPLRSVSVPTSRSTLAVLVEAQDCVVVSDPLRTSLEAANIPGLTFFEPILVGQA